MSLAPVLSLLLASAATGVPMRPVTAEDTTQDLLSHPAFAGFGRLLLPWDDRPADSTRLRDVGSLLPYHSFSYVASLHEGFPYAVAIRKHGLNAFVLKYRVGSGGGPATRDLAAAISHVFRNAKALGVGTEAYSLWGGPIEPPTFVVVGEHDGIAPPSVMERRVARASVLMRLSAAAEPQVSDESEA